jgi:hypothetical protein
LPLARLRLALALSSLALAAAAAADVSVIQGVESQSLSAQVKRLIEAMEFSGGAGRSR